MMLWQFLITFYGLYPEIENVGLTQNYEFFYHQCPSISISVIFKNKIDHLSACSNPSGSQSFIITFMNRSLYHHSVQYQRLLTSPGPPGPPKHGCPIVKFFRSQVQSELILEFKMTVQFRFQSPCFRYSKGQLTFIPKKRFFKNFDLFIWTVHFASSG